MEQRDYILRLIERFGQFAIALRKLILGGRAGSGAVREELQAVARHAGLDLEIARAVTAETLALVVAPGGDLEPGRCWMYAETLYLDGLDAELSGDAARAFDSYEKARMLYETVAPMGAFLVGFTEARRRIEEIDARLAELETGGGDGGPGGGSRARRLRTRRPLRRTA